jgi:hypothetical protein
MMDPEKFAVSMLELVESENDQIKSPEMKAAVKAHWKTVGRHIVTLVASMTITATDSQKKPVTIESIE